MEINQEAGASLSERRHGPGRRWRRGRISPAAARRKLPKLLTNLRRKHKRSIDDGTITDAHAADLARVQAWAKKHGIDGPTTVSKPKAKTLPLATKWKKTPNSYKDCPHCGKHDVGQPESGAKRRQVRTSDAGTITVVTCTSSTCGKEFRL